ncbi:uncharacterized protein MONBRDRAFT_32700 [Monosiga brevicollis MX1]|uniref:3-hydroxy-3-methylglutaryl coenzyme A reductase n=1 Tax=Monosiga brevicollis TaxID=81824 RepID=A9V162_MONBE|nr:uncharacterized protein MONBRDRAFT_32700 [Monosiga brevicollis MX1]EDQ88876.1 predicted protein [Monosiga brevicollis MX1]|eukprot:XP_001746489.1 hypothetical protein [Monosiga brevicollis MX1]
MAAALRVAAMRLGAPVRRHLQQHRAATNFLAHQRNVATTTRDQHPLAAATSMDASSDFANMTDEAVLQALHNGDIKLHNLEKELRDCHRAVNVRRAYLADCLHLEGKGSDDSQMTFKDLPADTFDYQNFYGSIEGANCEAVIGYLPLPVGVVGPLVINEQPFRVPMATTEGALVASTNRGCRAISKAGGAKAIIVKNGMTRAPLLRLPSASAAAQVRLWIEQPENKAALTEAFNSTTRFGRLQSIDAWVAGRNLYVRFACHCGDAMGMNMVTKGCHKAVNLLQENFPDAQLISMSGNACSDKKAAAINWVSGRGRSVVAEALIPNDIVRSVLKTTPDAMISVNINKNLIGSAIAGTLGGYNAHAANIVAAVFLATGNDPAQVVESSQCLTILEKDGDDLHVSVTMPAIEVGTVGGGTSLPAQAAALKMLGCQGANREQTGANADTLAHVVASSVMAGELSLIAALATDDLLKAHIELNRKAPTPSNPAEPQKRGMHTDARQLHTGPQRHYAAFIGHPSAGGPVQHGQHVSSALHDEPSLYFYPGMSLETMDIPCPIGVEMAAVSDEDLYGEGPMLVVP